MASINNAPDPETAFDDECSYVEEFDAVSISVRKPKPSGGEVKKYPAKLHARSVAKRLGVKQGLIYLPGQPSADIPDSDQPVPFRQRRYFFYLSGADFEDCALLYDVGADSLTLFIPSADPKEVVWLGPVPSIKECESKYDVDHVCHNNELRVKLMAWIAKGSDAKIYLLHKDETPKFIFSDTEVNTYGLRYFYGCDPALAESIFDASLLQPAMDAARVIKSPYEISMIRNANAITASAHRAVLSRVRSFTNETQIEAHFQSACVSRGAKHQAYGIIAGSGANASTLHYVANNEPLEGRELVVLDAGCEWNCYASDVTRSFPISGTWSAPAKEIYDLVASMQDTVLVHLRPGVVFRDLHVLSMRVAVRGLMKLGILHNGTFDEVFGTGVAFYPHGLGHHLGLECHDVIETQRLLAGIETHHDLRRPIPQHARIVASPPPYTKRQRMQPGMVVTVEPGIYFSRYALEEYWLKMPLHRKYINVELLERYYPVGGVRIEDDILITEEGWENLTTAPKGEDALRIIRGVANDMEGDDWSS